MTPEGNWKIATAMTTSEGSAAHLRLRNKENPSGARWSKARAVAFDIDYPRDRGRWGPQTIMNSENLVK